MEDSCYLCIAEIGSGFLNVLLFLILAVWFTLLMLSPSKGGGAAVSSTRGQLQFPGQSSLDGDFVDSETFQADNGTTWRQRSGRWEQEE